jgi:hypothetical protein
MFNGNRLARPAREARLLLDLPEISSAYISAAITHTHRSAFQHPNSISLGAVVPSIALTGKLVGPLAIVGFPRTILICVVFTVVGVVLLAVYPHPN